MPHISANDLTQISDDLRKAAKKYSDSEIELGQQILTLDGQTMSLIYDSSAQWKGLSSEAFIGAWNQRRARLQQAVSLMRQSGSILTQMAQQIDDYVPAIQQSQSLLQSHTGPRLGADDRQSIMSDISQAENSIIMGLATLNTQLEALAEEVADCPEEQENPIYGTDPGKDGINKNDTNGGGKNEPTGKENGTPDAVPVDVQNLDPQQTRSETYEALEALKRELESHPELKGEFMTKYNNLVADYKDASEILSDPQTDPELATLAHTTIFDLKGETSAIIGQIQERYPFFDLAQEPTYILENRVPLDSETILDDSNRFIRTSMNVKGAVVYRDKETGWYYQRDTFHTGVNAEIEVYGPDGKHRGTITPDGTNKNGPVSGRGLQK